jgi:predicted RND superfamily exporter protein
MIVLIVCMTFLCFASVFGEYALAYSEGEEPSTQAEAHHYRKLASQNTSGETGDVIVSDSSIIYESMKTLLYFLVFILVLFLFVILKSARKKKE